MAVIHITEAEAARDLPAVLAKASAGEEIEIEGQSETFVLVRSKSLQGRSSLDQPPPSEAGKPRLLSEVLTALIARNSQAIPAPGFADDVEDGIRSHENDLLFNPWE